VLNRRRLAVHRDAGAHDLAAEYGADRHDGPGTRPEWALRGRAPELTRIVTPACSDGPARARSQCDSALVCTTSSSVTVSFRITCTTAPSSPRLHEVVGEGVVVVDH